MKGYYLFAEPPTSFKAQGFYHWMSLPDSGYVAVTQDDATAVPSDWKELPHLMDSSAANFNGVNITPGAYSGSKVPLAGISITDSVFQVAFKLGKLNQHFQP